MYYLVIVYRASRFFSGDKLSETKTKHIMSCLQDFIEVYYGPPLLFTSDGGPQFQAANKAIQEWAHGLGIKHELSAAYSPQSNEEAESAVKLVKHVIFHCDGKVSSIKTACHYVNWEQRLDGSGSEEELFLQHSNHIPGLVTIPHTLSDNSQENKTYL